MDSRPPHAPTSFGELLRLLRQRARLTQRELADMVGYSDAHINRFEKGGRTPDHSVVAARFVNALGLEPDSDLAARLIDLARKAAHKPAQVTPNRAIAGVNGDEPVHTRLPAPTTDLLGRDSDIKAALATLNRDNVRMLTLVGPPGVGKTRLAIQLARALEGQYQHGALFVALAAVADGSLIADAILQALGVTSNTQNPLAQVKNVLHKRNMVLVLDNFEHLLEFGGAEMATSFVAELMAAAPNVKVLITSRTPLHLSGDHIYEVTPLAPATARELFVQRATALSPSFKPRSHDEDAIAAICRRLDYLPLAIELAAARIRLFEPQALLKRLAEPFAVLTVGPKDLPHRQRTLRNAIDWSYNLLAPEEQTLFRRLSIFADGCTLPMIEAVAGDDLTSSVLDLTQSLVDKSMLKAEMVNGVIRFRLLEMLREYASELLARSSEATTIAQRGAQWFVDQVQTMQSDPAIGDSAIWFDWFDAEVNNIRAVIHWSMQSGHIDYGLRLAAELGVTWRLHGPVRDGFQLISHLLAHQFARDDMHLYARVLLSGAHIAEEIGESTLSEKRLSEALAIFRQVRDQRMAAWALSYLGHRSTTRANYPNARAMVGESIAIFRKTSDKKGLALALLWLGTIERDQGNYHLALDIYREVTSIARKIKSPIMSFLAAGWTSFVYKLVGELDSAKAQAEMALGICEANRLTGSAALMLGTLGDIALFQGDLDDAIEKLKRARDGLELHGNLNIRAGTLINLGLATHLKGDSATAESMIREALRMHWECGHNYRISDSLFRLAWIAVDRNDLPHAVRLMGAAAAVNTHLAKAFPVSEQVFHQPRLQAAKSSLSQADFESFWREGQAMDCKAAVDFVLDRERRPDDRIDGKVIRANSEL